MTDDSRVWKRKASDDWYQTIELSDGSVIQGKVDTRKRLRFLENQDFEGKTVLDIGCNSGQFSLYAKKHGASRVVGVDINETRLAQARSLAEQEGLDVEFQNKSLFDLASLGRFDIVFCFAVVTEVQDLFGALKAIKDAAGGTLYLELELAKPLLYLSGSAQDRSKAHRLPLSKAVGEIKYSGDMLVVSPSFEVVEAFFGAEFACERLGTSIRYDMLKLTRQRV